MASLSCSLIIFLKGVAMVSLCKVRGLASVMCALLLLNAYSTASAESSFLREIRDKLTKYHIPIIVLVCAAVAYKYYHKIVKRAIDDYYRKNSEQAPSISETLDEINYFDASVEALVKSTKLIGTVFKVLRAATCPGEGKIASDQWLDDCSGLA